MTQLAAEKRYVKVNGKTGKENKTMTVAELIKALEKVEDKNLKVVYLNPEGQWVVLEQLTVEYLALALNRGGSKTKVISLL